jgi:ubiquinone/menaquinone biosynthesis C-methylase UbiE
MMSQDQAVDYLRNDSKYTQFVRDVYLDEDVFESAKRFAQSPEFAEVKSLLSGRISGKILDLGAGRGIASYAFSKSGAEEVYAVEPDPSDKVGRGTLAYLCRGLNVSVIEAMGENIPLPDEEVDVVYMRQVLHHIRDLPSALQECARVLKQGGVLLACREHVVDNHKQLETFLEHHLTHQLAGGENAYSLPEYRHAIEAAGLKMEKVIEPWDSIINAFPAVKSHEELANYARIALGNRFGIIGCLAGRLPGVNALAWLRLKRPIPGRMYSFLALKP